MRTTKFWSFFLSALSLLISTSGFSVESDDQFKQWVTASTQAEFQSYLNNLNNNPRSAAQLGVETYAQAVQVDASCTWSVVASVIIPIFESVPILSGVQDQFVLEPAVEKFWSDSGHPINHAKMGTDDNYNILNLLAGGVLETVGGALSWVANSARGVPNTPHPGQEANAFVRGYHSTKLVDSLLWSENGACRKAVARFLAAGSKFIQMKNIQGSAVSKKPSTSNTHLAKKAAPNSQKSQQLAYTGKSAS